MENQTTTRRLTDAEKRAIEHARYALETLWDTNDRCAEADLTGSEITNALRDASKSILYAIAVMEGRT